MLFGKRNRNVKRILIVEDEPLTAFDTEQLLIASGYEIAATNDRVAEAEAVLDRDSKVDLILADVRLTGERTGVDLARIAKERGVPLLFVTAAPPPEAEELAIGVLPKPYASRTLKAALLAIDQLLSGGQPKPVAGLILYPPSKD